MKIKINENLSFLLVFVFVNSFFAQNINELIVLGDNEVNINYNYSKGLKYYNDALELEPNNINILNKISRATVFIGDYLPLTLKNIENELKFGKGLNNDKESLDSNEIEEAQIENYKQAYELADRILQIDPKNVEAYVRRAIANARIAKTKGIFTVAKLVNEVKEDLEFAIKLGTGTADIKAVAHYLLAKTHDVVSDKWAPARSIIGLGWGDIEIALKEYQIAINLKSDVRAFYLDFAKALIEENEEELAIKMLKKIESCPILESEDGNRLSEAKKILADL